MMYLSVYLREPFYLLSRSDMLLHIFYLLDYFTQQLGIDTFYAKTEIAKIESQIINLYQESNNV